MKRSKYGCPNKLPEQVLYPIYFIEICVSEDDLYDTQKTKGKLSQSVKRMPCRAVPLGSARLGSARLGPVPVPVRSGPVRVGRKLPMYVVSLYAFDMIISKKSCFSATFVLQICVKLWLYLPIHHYVCANRIALADTRVSHYAARL